jgi:hypothetical protein
MRHILNWKVLVLGAFGAVIIPEMSTAKTWYVQQSGEGDAPTIRAAVDSAVSGDTVLVGPGTHEIGTPVFLKSGLVITSESGPLYTRLVPKPLYYPDYAFACRFMNDRTEISGFWIEGFRFGIPDNGAITVLACQHLCIVRNVFVDNLESAITIDISYVSNVEIAYNTIISADGGFALSGNGAGSVSNNILWGDCYALDGIFWIVRCNNMMDVNDAGPMAILNFQADPQFCGTPDNGNLYLQEDSPCAPGNTPPPLEDCGLAGAFPVGCNTTPVRKVTWGYIKNLYK